MIRFLTALLVASVVIAASPAPRRSTPSPRASAPVSVPNGASFAVGIWTVHTTSADLNFKSGDFSTPNRLVMTREGGDITADRANGNFKTQFATLYGNVTMHDLQGNFAGLASASVARPNGPATMTADQVRIDGKARVYTAIGHVHYVQGITTVDSARGRLDDVAHLLYLDGNVRVSQGLRSLAADHVVYDTIASTAHAQGNVTMQFPSTVQPHFATPRPIRILPRIHRTPSPHSRGRVALRFE